MDLCGPAWQGQGNVCVHVCAYECTHVSLCTCVLVGTHVQACVYMLVCACVCVFHETTEIMRGKEEI